MCGIGVFKIFYFLSTPSHFCLPCTIRHMVRKKTHKKIFNQRVVVVYVLFALGFIAIIARMAHLQLVQGEDFAQLADEQYVTHTGIAFDRGDIYFTSKDGQLQSAATVHEGYKLYIHPDELGNSEVIAAKLATVIEGFPTETFIQKASRKDDPYEEIVERLSKEQADAVRDLDIDGIGLARDRWRTYPLGQFAPHVVGIIGDNNGLLEGKYGIERTYEPQLRRQQVSQTDIFAGVFANIEGAIEHAISDEAHVITSIEPTVQQHVAKTTQATIEKWNATAMGMMVMDTKTGEIYGMYDTRSFDPNALDTQGAKNLTNPFVEHVYEMGSVLKPLIMAMGIEEEQITPETSYYDGGSVQVGPHTIYNFDKRGRGTVTMGDVLRESLNTGMIFVMDKLRKQDVRNYFEKLGVGERTGIDLPFESNGITSNLNSRRDIEFANISFGQGLALTPSGTAKALSAIPNYGIPVTPHLGTKTQALLEKEQIIPWEENEQVFSAETTEQVTRMMTAVVDKSFRDNYPELQYHSIAAKTGTAQIPNPAGGYYDDRNLHSFFGFFPAYEPRFMAFMYLIHPKNVKYSSQTLSGPFMDTVSFLSTYYNVPPDRVVQSNHSDSAEE